MYNITLINTIHKAVGECNSIELYKILQTINPDVIFEEIPSSFFSKYYLERSSSTLETNAINMYLENFKALNIPVDIDNFPPEEFFRAYQNALERLLEVDKITGTDFKTLLATKKHYTAVYGFTFLNSDLYDQCNDKVNNFIENAFETMNDEKLIQAVENWNDFNTMREHTMLENIYDYSKNNNYSKAVFLIGAQHGKSIKQKLQDCKYIKLPRLNWTIYGE